MLNETEHDQLLEPPEMVEMSQAAMEQAFRALYHRLLPPLETLEPELQALNAQEWTLLQLALMQIMLEKEQSPLH